MIYKFKKGNYAIIGPTFPTESGEDKLNPREVIGEVRYLDSGFIGVNWGKTYYGNWYKNQDLIKIIKVVPHET